MRILTHTTIWATGLILGLGVAATDAGQPVGQTKIDPKTGKPIYPISPDLVEPPKKPKPFPLVQPFANSPFGAHPTLGTPENGGQGYPHYSMPDYRYDVWYRPDRFGWGVAERCAPPPFRPRGYGNLFNRPSTCYRMDYNRYVLKNHRTDYGPSYYFRSPDQRCPDLDHSERHRPGCDSCRTRQTQVWTIRGCNSCR